MNSFKNFFNNEFKHEIDFHLFIKKYSHINCIYKKYKEKYKKFRKNNLRRY